MTTDEKTATVQPEIEAFARLRAVVRLPPTATPDEVVAVVQRVVPPAGTYLASTQRYALDGGVALTLRRMTVREARDFHTKHHAFSVNAVKAHAQAVAYSAARAEFDAAMAPPPGTVAGPDGVTVTVDPARVALLADALAKRAATLSDTDADALDLYTTTLAPLVVSVEGVPELAAWPTDPAARADALVGFGLPVLRRLFDFAAACLAGVAPEARGN
jgi:hypothetical protein